MTRTQTDPAMPPEVRQVLFGLKKGEPTMVETPEGFLVATAVEIIAPDPATDAAAGYVSKCARRRCRERSAATWSAGVLGGVMRLRANPRINQANVDQIVQP